LIRLKGWLLLPEADLLHKILTARTVAFQMQAGIHLSNDHHEAFVGSVKPEMGTAATVSATGAAEAMITRDVLKSLFSDETDLYTLTFDIQLA
jgi:hypothetical protein